MTVGIYIRVSTQEQAQEGYSIAAQKERSLARDIKNLQSSDKALLKDLIKTMQKRGKKALDE